MPTAYLIYDRKAIAPKGADRPRRGRIGVIAKIALRLPPKGADRPRRGRIGVIAKIAPEGGGSEC
jgi:hypothetical protein